MDIHLAKPGGEREGPFSLEQINASLAQQQFRDTDYWAWYEGLDSWVPLHQVPGLVRAPEFAPEPSGMDFSDPTRGDTQIVQNPVPSRAAAQSPAPSRLFSGMPVEALEQIFVFTDGEGPVAMQSPATALMLNEILGADFSVILDQAPRDVFGRCSIPAQLAEQAKVPSSAWRAMSALRPELTQKARDGAYRVCVRTFEIETGQKVAVFMFYNKEKI